jgi:transposase
MQIYALNQFLGRQNKAIAALHKLQVLGITDDEIINVYEFLNRVLSEYAATISHTVARNYIQRFLDVVVERNIPEKTRYQNVIRIDMGIRHFASSVELAGVDDGKTKFFGNDLNRVRVHYFWLRRRLCMKKALDTIKKISVIRILIRCLHLLT